MSGHGTPEVSPQAKLALGRRHPRILSDDTKKNMYRQGVLVLQYIQYTKCCHKSGNNTKATVSAASSLGEIIPTT